MIDLSLRCPVCGLRADMCFQHGDDWKKRRPTSVHQKTEAQLRAGVNEFTQDDPPPYGSDGEDGHLWAERDRFEAQAALLDASDVVSGASAMNMSSIVFALLFSLHSTGPGKGAK